jgi:hypothetical protein
MKSAVMTASSIAVRTRFIADSGLAIRRVARTGRIAVYDGGRNRPFQ